jgi:hypothetical protein
MFVVGLAASTPKQNLLEVLLGRSQHGVDGMTGLQKKILGVMLALVR